MINSQVVLLEKLRSCMVLGASMNFNVQNTSLFEAIDRLHAHGVWSFSSKEIVQLLFKALRGK